MSETSPFSRPVVVLTLAAAAAIFALSMLLALNAPSEPARAGSDTRSLSALGQAGLFELLRRAEVPVARSEINGVVAPEGHDVLVEAEPADGLSNGDIVRLGRMPTVLLVLPKRTGTPDPNNPAWVESTAPIGIGDVATLARIVDPHIDIVRAGAPASWSTDALGVTPSFGDTVQLLEADDLTPILADGKNMLIAEHRDGDHVTWILADPDIVENHGLALGRNAELALALLDRLRQGDGRVIFDETIHGMVNPAANPFRKLLEFPLSIASALVVLAAALLLWATLGRFGRESAAAPAFDFGKRRLIATSAALLDRAGHQAEVTRRYVELTLRDIGRTQRAPRDLDDEALAAWLDAVGTSRGIEAKASDILARTGPSAGAPTLFAAAGDIHHWKNRISDGTSGHRSDR
jgi:hypothetical protein